MFVEMHLQSIILDEAGEQQFVFLREKEGPRVLPIVIGWFEAAAIDRKVKEQSFMRPLTHDLLNNTIGEMGGKLERINITELREGTFYAQLIIARNGETITIDARPSDAIALSVRAEVPIFVSDDVLEAVIGSMP